MTTVIGEIKRVVGRRFGVSATEIDSDRRDDDAVRARHLAMALAKRLTPKSYPAIGRAFGGKDHTTALHAVRKVEAQCAQDPAYARDIETLQRMIERRFEEREPQAITPEARALAEELAKQAGAAAAERMATELAAAALRVGRKSAGLHRAVAGLAEAAEAVDAERYGRGERAARLALDRAVAGVVAEWARHGQ